jgi:transposase
MGWTPPTASVCQSGVLKHHLKEASVAEVSTIGLDIAKQAFQVHGADALGRAVFRRKLVRSKLMEFFSSQPGVLSHWRHVVGRTTGGGRSLSWAIRSRLIPPAYVKPFVKRQKNGAADAEAICEAAQRPSMRFVSVKDETQQASGVVFRAREVLVRQRKQCINALRGHLPIGVSKVAPSVVKRIRGRFGSMSRNFSMQWTSAPISSAASTTASSKLRITL